MKSKSALRALIRATVFLASLSAAVAGSGVANAQTKIFEFFGDNPAPGNAVGTSAAVGQFDTNDLDADLVIGAPGWNYAAGAVYVLRGPLSNAELPWIRLSYDASANGVLGTSVTYSPTFRSGQPVFVVGAPYAGGSQRGRAFEYYEDATIHSVQLAPTTLQSTDRFGHISISCDFNGDGYEDLVIGTDHHVSDALSGAVYVFLGGTTADTLEDLKIYPTYASTN